jgi:uncharacterized membrane protein
MRQRTTKWITPVALIGALAISARGTPQEQQQESAKTDKPTFTKIDVPFPGAVGSLALDINPQGDIVGEYLDSSFNLHNFLLSQNGFSNIDPPGGRGPAFFFAAGNMGINPQGEIVGNFVNSSGNDRGFLLSHGTYTTIDAPGASDLTFGTWAAGINPRGDIVGFYFDSSGNTHGFLLSKGTFTKIDFPGGSLTQVNGINPGGDIVGDYTDSSGNTHSFLL